MCRLHDRAPFDMVPAPQKSVWHVWVRQYPWRLSLPRQTALRQQCTHLCLLQYFELAVEFFTHKKALPATASMPAPVLLTVFSIRLGVASRKMALPCVLLTHRLYRRSLPAPPERAFVQAPWRLVPGRGVSDRGYSRSIQHPRQTTPRAACRSLSVALQSSRRRFPSFKPAPLSIIIPYTRQSDLSLSINHITLNRGRRSRAAQQGGISQRPSSMLVRRRTG